ncbi:exonuclease domain-containing protein [Marinicella sp. W31]|uniref:exonuclease domain-containing protein n=1 Tax=Marinicella sp. W31 TaxID=3023713 RepID=UPI00375685B6
MIWKSRRRRQLQQHNNAYVAGFYQAEPIKRSQRIIETKLVALDVETTGLSPLNDRIISVAVVPFSGSIDLQHSRYFMIQQQLKNSDAVLIHGITDEDMAAAEDEEVVLEQVLDVLRNAVMLAHHGDLDWRFLQHRLQLHFQAPLMIQMVDTMGLEMRRLQLQQQPIVDGMLTLGACRQRYGLPDFAQHDARNDALATAELFLAQLSRLGGIHKARLKDVGMHWKT